MNDAVDVAHVFTFFFVMLGPASRSISSSSLRDTFFPP